MEGCDFGEWLLDDSPLLVLTSVIVDARAGMNTLVNGQSRSCMSTGIHNQNSLSVIKLLIEHRKPGAQFCLF